MSLARIWFAKRACDVPPHKDRNRLADKFLSWSYVILSPHESYVGIAINRQRS